MFTWRNHKMKELEKIVTVSKKKILTLLAAGIMGLTIGGCDKIGGKEVPDHPVMIELGVSEYESLTGRKGCQFGYLGMSSKDFFRVGGCYHGGVIDSAAYSVEAEEICFGTEVFEVLEVTPEHISLKYLPSEVCD